MLHHDYIIAQTRKWILDVVVGCNFCPFAAREMKEGRVFYEVVAGTNFPHVKPRLLNSLKAMDKDPGIETLFLIFPQSSFSFSSYLALVKASERTLKKEGYEGIYQIASFHPEYLFAGSNDNDPANYTNRSPYAMMQVLRERSLTLAIDRYPDTLAIPENNIAYTREKGLAWLKLLRDSCFDINN